MTVIAPTLRQLEVLRWIDRYQRRKGFSPSIRGIGEGLGISSTNGVNDLLKRLEKYNLLRRHKGIARAFVITTRGRFWMNQPVKAVSP